MILRIQPNTVILSLLTTMLLSSCVSSKPPPRSSSSKSRKSVVVIDDHALEASVERNLGELVKAAPDHTPYAELLKQLAQTSCKLKLPRPGSTRVKPSTIYQRALATTVMVATTYHCKSAKCKKYHCGIASGVIIHSDGIVVTNYHVVKSKMPKILAMGVATYSGKTYLVDKVLAASKRDDVAILKLKNATGLTAAPIYRDEPTGNPVTVVSHPDGQFYTLTQGYVSRYTKNHGKVVMNITADYAKGSSGGPIFNNRGDLVGLVSSTSSIVYTKFPLNVGEDKKSLTLPQPHQKAAKVNGTPVFLSMDHQMTVKNSVPSRAILDLIK